MTLTPANNAKIFTENRILKKIQQALAADDS